MRTDGHTIRGQGIVAPYLDLEAVGAWAKRTFSTERIADIVLFASTAAVLGMVLFSLYRAVENYTIVAF